MLRVVSLLPILWLLSFGDSKDDAKADVGGATFTKSATVVVDKQTDTIVATGMAEAALTYVPPDFPIHVCKRLDIVTRPWPDTNEGGEVATKGACDAGSVTQWTSWPAPAKVQVTKQTKDRAIAACKKQLSKSPTTNMQVVTQSSFPARLDLVFTYVNTAGPLRAAQHIKREYDVTVPVEVTCQVPSKPKAKPTPGQPNPSKPTSPTSPESKPKI